MKKVILMSERYENDTCWIEVEGNTAEIGLRKEAVEDAEEFVFVKLPEKDERLSGGDVCVTLESSKSTSEVESPLTGRVTENNDDVFMNPALINDSPEKSWLFRIEIEDHDELRELKD